MDPPRRNLRTEGVTIMQNAQTPLLSARGLVKTYGSVVALDGVDLHLYAGDALIKCLTGAEIPDVGTLAVDGREVHFRRPQDAREVGIETVYQSLSLPPDLDIASNIFLGRELRKRGVLGSAFRMLDYKTMRAKAQENISALGIRTIQNITQVVETLSGGQRQAVAIARAVAFGSRIVVLDEPTAALGVRETAQVLGAVTELRDRGLGVILISHSMPDVFKVADRIQIQRLGQRAAVVTPATHTASEVVAVMTGAVSLVTED